MSQKLNYLQLPAFLFFKSHVRVDTEHVHLYLVFVCVCSVKYHVSSRWHLLINIPWGKSEFVEECSVNS